MMDSSVCQLADSGLHVLISKLHHLLSQTDEFCEQLRAIYIAVSRHGLSEAQAVKLRELSKNVHDVIEFKEKILAASIPDEDIRHKGGHIESLVGEITQTIIYFDGLRFSQESVTV